MRRLVVSFIAVSALLLPRTSASEIAQYGSPAPEVTAATAPWQVNDDYIVVQGLVYYPTRETRMFDSQVMTQIDVYEGVPVYADTTREPFTLVYVPLTRSNMRTYERADTPDTPVISGRGRAMPPRTAPTTGTIDRPLEIERESPADTTFRRRTFESIPPPHDNSGVWISFNGRRWFSDGAAVVHMPNRFVQVGTYRGFPVYRDAWTADDRIWIPAVIGGPLTPYGPRRRL
jgi:hypothetical protein